VQAELAGAAMFVGTAAVADYRPEQVSTLKIKKTQQRLELALTRTTDILAGVAARADRPFVVGFAAETNAVEQHAREKLLRKNLDMIAANEVGACKAFDCEDNSLLVLWRGGRAELPQSPKLELARSLVKLIVERWQARSSAAAAEQVGQTR
jgi:phosphopantothenoylcysteine decarboxylase/phosphopantothenate--cysteine ligase